MRCFGAALAGSTNRFYAITLMSIFSEKVETFYLLALVTELLIIISYLN